MHEVKPPPPSHPHLAFKNALLGTSLVAQWLKLYSSNAGGADSMPGQGTRIQNAVPRAPTPRHPPRTPAENCFAENLQGSFLEFEPGLLTWACDSLLCSELQHFGLFGLTVCPFMIESHPCLPGTERETAGKWRFPL